MALKGDVWVRSFHFISAKRAEEFTLTLQRKTPSVGHKALYSKIKCAVVLKQCKQTQGV